ncbi:GWxTD domain-containing protein [candidate division KSB1 bacterium]|nr:tetratricopeptide repeat protein [candidate division KSB1 bacterium]RQW01269.1 MAG: GWxTD domain-containing protein [candidate division KSB1 bacterium]
MDQILLTRIWILLFVASAVALFGQANQAISDLYHEGYEQLAAGNYTKAAQTFQEVVDEDPKNTGAWVGLGRAFLQLEPGSAKAERAFNAAVNRDRKNGEAYYWLGLLWTQRQNRHKEALEQLKLAVHFSPRLVDAWELLGFLHEQNANEKPAVLTFADALLANPEHAIFYENLLRTAYAYQYENIAIKALNNYLKVTDTPGRTRVDLAEAHRHKGDAKKANEIYTELEKSTVPWPVCHGHLVKARISFDLGEDETGCKDYWRAVAAINDSASRKEFYDDLCFIMQDHEYDLHAAARIDSVPTFYRRFWRSRDPNLKTELNERIPEHYRRLNEAEKKWRRSPVGYEHSILIHERSVAGGDEKSPFRNLNLVGDEFIDVAHFPKALPRDRTINDLGVVYIRHGPPSEEIRPNFSSAGYNTTWIYKKEKNRPGMIFHFQRIGEHTGWVLEAIPSNTENLERLDSRYADLQDSLYMNGRLAPAVRGLAEQARAISLLSLQTGMTTETTNYHIPERPMDIPFQYVIFKGETANEVELYYLIHGGAVDLDETQKVDVEEFLCIHNQKWDEVTRHTRHIEQRLNLSPEQWGGSGFVMREAFPLPPGDYFVEFQLLDNVGIKRAIHKDTVAAPNYEINRLMLSDVIVAGEIDESRTYAFERNGIPFSPHMFYAFRRDDFIGIYFEIYNLQQDIAGKTQYEISFTLQHAELDEPERPRSVLGFVKNLFMDKRQVTTKFENEGRTSDDYIYMNLQFPDRRSGQYRLIIQVKDLQSGQTSARQALITLL